MNAAFRKIVRFLTPRARRRRLADNLSAHGACILLAMGAAIVAPVLTAAAEDWQALADVEATAERFVSESLGPAAAASETRAQPLDRRLRLASCDRSLDASLRTAGRNSRQRVVAVSCQGSRPWKVYVPVDVLISEAVLVARHSLSRGHRLEAGDVTVEDRDVSRLAGGYLAPGADLAGQRLRQTIAAGTIITPSVLEARTLVRRGQGVTLTVAAGDIDIRMAGKALMDGVLNERIRVQNLSSERIVEGVVRSAQTVEVMVR